MSGGGDGLGSILSVAAPAALMMIPGVGEAAAPLLTGMGMSGGMADILAPALMGAALSGGTAALTGGSPLKSALMGGVAAGLGAGITDEAPAASSAASDAAASPLSSIGTDTANAASTAPLSQVVSGTSDYASPQALSAIESGNASQMPGIITPAEQASTNAIGDSFASGAASPLSSTTPAASDSPLHNAMQWAGKNPLQAAILGNAGLSAIESFLPRRKVNIGQNASQVLATNPGWNATIPPYAMRNTAAPYTGNWYTYGQQPETSLYNGMPMPQKEGGPVGYARGGEVGYSFGGHVAPWRSLYRATAPVLPRRYASGGAVSSGRPASPLAMKAAFNAGHEIGRRMAQHSATFTGHGQVGGKGGGQDDIVPAKLSRGEFVIPADVTASLGDGSNDEGAKKLHGLINSVRAHKTGNGSKFPPKAKSPLAYIGGS